MKELQSQQLQAVSGGSIICGDMIPASMLQSINNEAKFDAWKAALFLGPVVAFTSAWAGVPLLTAGLMGSLSGSLAYNYEYTSSMNILNVDATPVR